MCLFFTFVSLKVLLLMLWLEVFNKIFPLGVLG